MGFCSDEDEVDWRFSVSMDRPFPSGSSFRFDPSACAWNAWA